MHGADQTFLFLYKEDRQAVGRPDDKQKTGEARDGSITAKGPLRRLVDEMDNVGVHLVKEYGFQALADREPAEVFLPPQGISEPVPDKRDPLEPRNRHRGQHIIILFFASGCFFLSRQLNWANTYFIENTVAGKYQTELSPAEITIKI